VGRGFDAWILDSDFPSRRLTAMQPQVFQPDADYCVYCHAVAAGPCAECGALCCGDCVEVVLRFTSQRAVCKPCLAATSTRGRARPWRWVAAAALIVVVGLGLWVLAR
jgi:hypothetical protein